MRSAVLVLLALLALAAGTAGPAVAQANQARLRAVNASPDAPPLDVQVNNVTAFANLPFQGITPYTPVNAAVTNVRFSPSGSPESPLFKINVQLLAGTDSTFVAVGTVSSVEPVVLFDDNRPTPPGQARVRFMNASPNVPSVNLSVVNGPVLFSNVPFKGIGGFITINAGTFDLQVSDASTGSVLATMPGVALSSCTVFTVFAMGLAGGEPPLRLVISTDATPGCVTPVPAVPVVSATPSSTPTPTATPTMTATATGTITATAVRSPTPSPTATAVRSATPSPTAVASPTATSVASPTRTPTTPAATALVATPTTGVTASPSGVTVAGPTATTGPTMGATATP